MPLSTLCALFSIGVNPKTIMRWRIRCSLTIKFCPALSGGIYRLIASQGAVPAIQYIGGMLAAPNLILSSPCIIVFEHLSYFYYSLWMCSLCASFWNCNTVIPFLYLMKSSSDKIYPQIKERHLHRSWNVLLVFLVFSSFSVFYYYQRRDSSSRNNSGNHRNAGKPEPRAHVAMETKAGPHSHLQDAGKIVF